MLFDPRFGWHSLVAAYGIAPEKVIFIPHGVVLPQSIKHSAAERHLLQQTTLRRLCSSMNSSDGMPSSCPCTGYNNGQGLTSLVAQDWQASDAFLCKEGMCPRYS